MKINILLTVFYIISYSCQEQRADDCQIKNEELRVQFQNQSRSPQLYTNNYLDSVSIVNLQCDSLDLTAIINRLKILEWQNKDEEEIKFIKSITLDSIKNANSFLKNEIRYRFILLKLNNKDTIGVNNILNLVMHEERNDRDYFNESNTNIESLLYSDYVMENKKMHFYITNANILTALNNSNFKAQEYLRNSGFRIDSSDKNYEQVPYKISEYAIENNLPYNPIEKLNKIIHLERQD